MAKSVIELNGQMYDSTTGKLLGSAPIKTVAKKPVAQAIKTKGQQLDGFTRVKTPVRPTAAKARPQPQKSQTLMRTAVKKPAVPAKIHAKAPVTTSVPKKVTQTVGFVAPVKPGRAIRATNTPQSNLISKFGSVAATIRSEVLPVKSEPTAVPAQVQKAAPKVAAPVAASIKQAPAQEDPFQKAIEQAISHEQPKIKKTKLHHRVARKLHVSPKVVNLAGFVVAAFVVSGFLVYQNLPQLAMRVAATRSGLSAKLPSYQPAGYAVANPIQYQPGQVTVSYKSASDKRAFNVTQKNSSWNSETLLENFVSTTGLPYQTVEANGRTIYIYGGNKATWVDGGIWYNIDGQSNLNSDQLLRIASSL